MNARFLLILPVLCGLVLAQSNQKFRMYGFADVAMTKYFPDEHAFIRMVDRMDEKLIIGLDHFSLYQDFRPNDRLQFLSELAFLDKPPTYINQSGTKVGGEIVSEASLAAENSTIKGHILYEWGSFSVERAQFTVNANRYFNFTVGKFITPAGIWNVDHGSPVIISVNQPAQYQLVQIYPKSQIGIQENGMFFLGDADLKYTIYVSSGRGNPTIRYPRDVSVGGQLILGLPVLDEFRLGLSAYTGMVDNTLRYMSVDPVSGVSSFEDVTQIRYREKVGGIDCIIKKSIFRLQAEVNYQQMLDHLNNEASSGTFAPYILFSVDAYKTAAFRLTPYIFWEDVSYIDNDNNPTGGNSTMDGFTRFMAGLNMKILGNYGIKTEFEFTHMKTDDDSGTDDVPGFDIQFTIAF